MDRRLLSCSSSADAASHPFDAVASEYDSQFTNTQLGRWVRETAWKQVAVAFRAGDTVLDLGCGTGEDAIWLARHGVKVLATDASPAMLEVAYRKAQVAGVTDRIEFEILDLGSVKDAPCLQTAGFDGVLSNFGALNCLPDRTHLARALARAVRPEGLIVLVLMGPVCPWEMGWHLLHLDIRSSLRRFQSGLEAHLGCSGTTRVWYPSPRKVRAEFAQGFRHLRTVGIGALLPPSYLSHLVERHPRLFQALALLDRRIAPTFPWTWLNDHYLMMLERI